MQLKRADFRGGVAHFLSATIIIQSFSFLSIKISTLESGWWAVGFLLCALILMGLRAVIWQHLLRRAELSQVYPFTALVQVLILVYAAVFFNEAIHPNHVVGMLLMLGGIYIMSRE